MIFHTPSQRPCPPSASGVVRMPKQISFPYYNNLSIPPTPPFVVRLLG